MNVRDVGGEGDGCQVVNRAGQEILLTAVFLHQNVRLTWVKEDLTRRHQQDAGHHALTETAGLCVSLQTYVR